MKGYLTSYAGLYEGGSPADETNGRPAIREVRIPLIQRDYAQGRPNPAAQTIRADFLDVLLRAIAGEESVGLDFIYGKVEDGVLHPLDGQQRLTTLFLIHWYLASLAGEPTHQAPWARFSYETRPSARHFSESLVGNPLPQGVESPAAWIRDEPWYLYTWRNDPTIESMLVMIDAIHERAKELGVTEDAAACWERLTAEPSVISFYLLPLEDMGSEEELYIKMNSRGKPLTEFENFKAQFEQDIRHSSLAGEFAHKIDGQWSDLMWSYRGDDGVIDDELMRYMDYVTEICEFRDPAFDHLADDSDRRLNSRARAIFGADNPASEDHLRFLFEAFDVWGRVADLPAFFAEVFSTVLPADDGYDPAKVPLFGQTGVNLFELCCQQFESQRGPNRPFSVAQSLLLYAVLLHLARRTDAFPRRVRMLRNFLISAGDEVRRQNMPELLKDVEVLIVDGDLDAVTKFSVGQREDERQKAAFLEAHPELASTLFRLEDHTLIRGTLAVFELTSDRFRERVEAFERAFADPDQWLNLTGALLATGDYQRRRPGTQSWQFGTASPSNGFYWRYLLTSGTRDDLALTREVLADFLDELSSSPLELEAHLNRVTSSWLADREERSHFDWRYYLVKYPQMRGAGGDRQEGKTGIYSGPDGRLGYSLCMLRTVQLNGNYRDPFLLQAWLSSGIGDAAVDPWFSGWPSTPRWLRLERSGVGLRSVDEGFELDGPQDEALIESFMAFIGRRGDVVIEEGRTLLRIPQVEGADGLVDAIDRIAASSTLLKGLVAAGL